MSNIRKIRFIGLFFIVSILLAGCFWQQTTEERMYEILENVAAAEKGFEDQQEPLVELEKSEKDLYGKIIALDSKEHDQVVKLSDEAIDLVEKRKEHMEKEKESLKASQKEFEQAKPLISDLEEKKVEDKANELAAVMDERYEIHNRLYKLYLEGIKYDKELYELMKNEEASFEKLDQQITKINEVYKKVLSENEKFNAKTKEYNELKLSFYKASGLKVKTK